MIQSFAHFCNWLATWAPWPAFMILGLPVVLIRFIKRKGID